jgi:hypothetical protein
VAEGGVEFVLRWSLDRTYLHSSVETLQAIWLRAADPSSRSGGVSGAAGLLRELGRGPARVHLLSNGPAQLRWALEERLRQDRVRWDRLSLEPSLTRSLTARIRAVSDRVGRQLATLLEARVEDQTLGDDAELLPEMLLGDDTDSDAFLYSLYADVLSGRVDRSLLRKVLRRARVSGEVEERCLESLSRLRHGAVVERILVHLDQPRPPSDFDAYGSRMVPVYNLLQAAFVLGEERRLSPDSVLRVAASFVSRDGFDHDALARSYLDLMRRGHVHGGLVSPLREAIATPPHDDAAGLGGALSGMCEQMAEQLRSPPPRVDRRPGELDYAALARRHGRSLVRLLVR